MDFRNNLVSERKKFKIWFDEGGGSMHPRQTGFYMVKPVLHGKTGFLITKINRSAVIYN